MLCLGGSHLCRRPSSSVGSVVTSDCDQRHLERLLLRVGVLHFAYDADEHVTIAHMTSSVIGRLLHCHTAVLESLAKRVSSRSTVYFHFVRPPKVYYGSEDEVYTTTSGVRPCAVTYDLKDGHQLYVKILETIVRTYRSLYNFSCYHVVWFVYISFAIRLQFQLHCPRLARPELEGCCRTGFAYYVCVYEDVCANTQSQAVSRTRCCVCMPAKAYLSMSR